MSAAKRERQRVPRIGRGISALVALVLGVTLLAPGGATAADVKHCGHVVKKIYSNDDYYRAAVLVTSGQVPCREARRVIWRALMPGGFWGGISGWKCEPRGSEPHVARCAREQPRRVIKSSKPRPCPACHRTLKILAGSWKNCGLSHARGDLYVKTEALGVGCTLATRVARKVLLHPSREFCEALVCRVSGFECPLNPARRSRSLVCTRGEERIRARGIKRG